MSRSYKHTPRAGDQKNKFFKKYSNRRLRRLPPDHPHLNNSSYKKHSCSWNICDCEEIGTSFEDYWDGLVRNWYSWRKDFNYPFPDRKQAYKDYQQMYLRK